MWWENSFHTRGNTLGAVFTSAEGSETKFSSFRDAFGAGSTELDLFFCVYRRDSIWEALGGVVTFPGAPRTCSSGALTLGPGGLGQRWGLQSWEGKRFHQEEFGCGASSNPCSSQNNTGQPHQIRPGLGTGVCLKRTEEAREGKGTVLLGNLSLLFKLSLLWFESANSVSAKERIFHSLWPPVFPY